jgi:parallel beta-helix repeat protein
VFGFTAAMPIWANDDGHGGDQDPKNLLVDDDKVQCPTATFTKIQDAVNAASNGATIRVCAGIYREQVTIAKSLTINGDNGSIVMPSSVVANTTSLAPGHAIIAAVILVMNSTDVDLSGLTVDGANNGINACAPDLIGIYYQNASGTIRQNTVRNIKLGPGLEGCQSGLGIFVQSGPGKSKVTIDTNSVHDFQKNGITGNEAGTSVTVLHNVVAGVGPTTGAAQNGIQIAFGATATVDSNISANHVWSPCLNVNCAASGTDILVFQSDGIEIMHNTAGRSQGGIFVQANNSNVHENTVFDTLVFDGIGFQGDGNKAVENTVTKSDESGIFVQGNNNKVTGNTIQEAPIGVLKMTGSTGTDIQGNQFINVPIPTVDPSGPVSKSSPYR